MPPKSFRSCSKQICNRRKREQNSQCQQHQCGGADWCKAHIATAPTHLQNYPRSQPSKDCASGDAGEWSSWIRKIHPATDRRNLVGQNCEHAEGERANAGAKYRGSAGAVGERCRGFGSRVHFAFPCTRWMVSPPSTGAFLLSMAPKNPATPADRSEAHTKQRTVLRSGG